MHSASAVVFGGFGAVGQAIAISLRRRGIGRIYVGSRSPVTSCEEEPDVTVLSFDAERGWDMGSISPPWQHPEVELTAAFYCIGIPSTKRTIAETPAEEFLRLMDVNAVGFVRAFQCVAEALRRSRGAFVALSSDATKTVSSRNGAYTASKVALEALALTLAKEEAPHGVRIAVLAPPLIDSPLGDHVLRLKGVQDKAAYARAAPWSRLLKVEEVAEAATALCYDEPWSYMSGEIIRLSAPSSTDSSGTFRSR